MKYMRAKRVCRLLTLLFVMFGLMSNAAVGIDGDSQDAKQIESLMRRWDAALVQRDIKYIDSILADDFTFISASGAMKNKAQHTADLKSADLVIEHSESSDIAVRIYGKTAVATARGVSRGRYKGNVFESSSRYTDVWIKQGDQWRVVSTQITRLAR